MNLDTTGNTVDEEKDTPTPLYHESVHPAKASKRFGLKGSAPYRSPKDNDPFNYEEKYPEDAYCEEMGQNARVFRTYLDERRIYDANMIEEARDGVDVLLVFAGLFSAVVTTFLVQTSQSLQADYAEMSANLLFEMINIQRAAASGASLDSVAASPLNPNTTFIASTTSVRVNGLWFASLALSLTTALVAVLVKQWLHHYMALPSGTPREQSLLRQFRFAGLQKWRVLVIIGLLPVLMHTALANFFVGLVIFLGPLRESIAWAVGTITVVAYTAYLMAHIIPLFSPQCPYRASLCDLLHVLYSRVTQYAIHHLRYRFRRSEMNLHAKKWKSLKELESDAVQSVRGELSVEALHWLFSMSSNPTVHSIVLQALGGLHPALRSKAQGLFNNIGLVLWQSCEDCLSEPSATYQKPLPGLETKLERLLRCKLVLSDENYLFIDPSQTPGVELQPSFTASIEKHRDYCGVIPFMKEVAHHSAVSFFHNSRDERWRLHPLVWIDLIRNGPWDEVFSPIDIGTEDPFALDICCAVLAAFLLPPWRDGSDSAKDMMNKSSGTAVAFHVATREYLFTDMTDCLLEMFAVFIRPSNVAPISPSLRILLVFTDFLISRLPLQGQVKPDALEFQALTTVLLGISNHDFFLPEASSAVFDVLDPLITKALEFIPMTEDTELPHVLALLIYSKLVYTKWHAISPRSLETVVNLMFDHYNSKNLVPLYASKIIARCLQEGSPAIYGVFRASRCLEHFGHYGYRPWLLEIIEGYLSTFGHSKSHLEASVVQEHIEYLHTPDLLFNVCSILAVGSGDPDGVNDPDDVDEFRKKQIKKNILSVVRIQRDAPVWDECRCRLRQLLEEDGTDFFYRQASVCGVERIPLSAEEIAEQRKYIRVAVETLDAFFLGKLDEESERNPAQRTAPAHCLPISRSHWSSRRHRLLPWHKHKAIDDSAAGNV
ncbi:hypothetical protein EV421DRAFT_1212204 [Armillaria borealis]|uniref:DUF6535 domain-containing protein n=1 Tax=Armillaria borealis TaxID=47425 RepID=A0AA39JY58_9AGAR|nr:hypothetical protein EV421DRAFT_1212204 [Armillaria borealis]